MKHSLFSDPWYLLGVVTVAAGLISIGLGVALWISA